MHPLIAAVAVAAATSTAVQAPRLTVYSRDLGFVREVRTLDLGGAGPDTVLLGDVSRGLDVSSARLVPEGGARVDRLAWRFDVANGDELLDRSLGQRVRVVSRGERVTEGVLVASDGTWLLVRVDDGTVAALSRQAVEDVRLARPPRALSLRPTLEAVVTGGRGAVKAELSYLTGGLSWGAEHTVVRSGETGATWSTAVRVDNTSGVEFRDARLKLVAGEPRRAGGTPQPLPMMRTMAAMDGAAKSADFSEAAFSEYHLYTLDRPATLRNNETQILTMLEPRSVKTVPRYFYRAGAGGVTAQLDVTNTKAQGLGVPLPAGRVRFFERDADGDLQFTGETTINHTPEGDTATLDIGTVFDLTAERKELANKRISDREREVQVEIQLRNRKKTDVTIVVEEPLSSDSEILQKTHEPVRKDSGTVRFDVPVKAGQVATLRYTARVRF
jgi:hypothetical protein